MFNVAQACVVQQKDLRFHERFRALKRQTSLAVAEEIDKHGTSSLKCNRKIIQVIAIGQRQAGTSTLLNRFVFHSYNRDQRQMFKGFVIEFVFKSFKNIINEMSSPPKIKYNDSSRRWDSIALLSFFSTNEINLPIKIIGMMRKLWDDEGIKESCTRLNECDVITYFLDTLDRLSQKGYVPSEEDLVRLDIATDVETDRETSFSLTSVHLSVYDISNVYPAVKKLMPMFEAVSCIIFITSLGDYCMTSSNDPMLNKMKENYALFQSICNSKWFADTAFLIFLNKLDIFEASLKTVPVDNAITTRSNTPEEGLQNVKKRFLELNSNKAKDIYTHAVSLIKYDKWPGTWFETKVNDIIIKQNLQVDGLF